MLRYRTLFLIGLIAASSPTLAGVALNPHVTMPGYGECDIRPDLEEIDCRDLEADPIFGVAFVWILASWYQGDLSGMSEVSFGVNHTLSYTHFFACNDATVDSESGWPASGTGARFTFDPCYVPLGCTAKVGLFIVNDGSSGEIEIVGDPRIGMASFTNCDGHTRELLPDWELGYADLQFGTDAVCGHLADGYCSVTTDVPVKFSTWSELRSLF